MSKTINPKSDDSPIVDDQLFDFSIPPEVMSPSVLAAYYQVRRAAMQRGDASLMPEGKKMSLIEIEELIGGELSQSQGPRPCCV